ncbi:3-oxoacyl-ACP synthase [Thermus thermamylovorans]|uniref:3-oxoacyl-ACP synthase n=1 Tax=Thermus thermamylovorans TaxID=2509362 RepID=A0A4Q9B8I6_9DEIN|nr:3-oxoacyl-ACP synthase [Thermus thermamylovorans]TBH21533.1 3-oxoacyl-ACP synthase [Thermus thermamylovorans]
MYARSLGVYLPEGRLRAEELAALSNLPAEVVREKLGLLEKPVPGPEDHPAEMAAWAAERALEAAGLRGERVDWVLSIVEEHKEYPVWATAPYLALRVGAHRAKGLDLNQKCASLMGALEVARGLFATRKEVRVVLVAGGYRNGDLVDYQDPHTRFLYDLAAGGGAMVLTREGPGLRLLGLAHRMDPSLALAVKVPVGGTRHPFTPENLDGYRLRVEDPEAMKVRLDATSIPTFLAVVREALEEAGYTEADLDYLALLHMKRSAHRAVLEGLGLREEQSVYLERFGHLGQLDPVLSLKLAWERGLLREGGLVALAAAGVGYFYAAAVLRLEGRLYA